MRRSAIAFSAALGLSCVLALFSSPSATWAAGGGGGALPAPPISGDFAGSSYTPPSYAGTSFSGSESFSDGGVIDPNWVNGSNIVFEYVYATWAAPTASFNDTVTETATNNTSSSATLTTVSTTLAVSGQFVDAATNGTSFAESSISFLGGSQSGSLNGDGTYGGSGSTTLTVNEVVLPGNSIQFSGGTASALVSL